jgi:hypothetical protein
MTTFYGIQVASTGDPRISPAAGAVLAGVIFRQGQEANAPDVLCGGVAGQDRG